MDAIEFKYCNEEIDAIGASACSECAALVYVWNEDQHREWHARTTAHVGTGSGSYDRETPA